MKIREAIDAAGILLLVWTVAYVGLHIIYAYNLGKFPIGGR